MSWLRAIGVLLLLGSLGAGSVLTDRTGVAAEAVSGPRGSTPSPAADMHVAASNDRRGVGVELQVLDLHLELAWFESVPVSPGRRLVLSWLARGPRGE
jgi:hypothetical protein